MGIFDFIKDAGSSVFGDDDDMSEPTKPLGQHLRDHGISTEGIKFRYGNDSATISGSVPSQELREKIITIVGNVKGIGQVEDLLVVAPPTPDSSQVETVEIPQEELPDAAASDDWESSTYTVQSGDTLGKIAREVYGSSSKYMTIFEANTPMLKDPNKIYPGQVLRIPKVD
jgi:nucleoid-associated protein YgaU